MSLEERVAVDLKQAMKQGDKVATRSIRAIKAALLLAKTEANHKDMTPDREIRLIQKLVKQRRDSLDIYEKQGREDLASVEREEIEILQNYLPKQMDEAELRSFLRDLINKLGAEGMKDMGRVMGAATSQLAGKADGKTISTIVRDLLA